MTFSRLAREKVSLFFRAKLSTTDCESALTTINVRLSLSNGQACPEGGGEKAKIDGQSDDKQLI